MTCFCDAVDQGNCIAPGMMLASPCEILVAAVLMKSVGSCLGVIKQQCVPCMLGQVLHNHATLC